MATWRVVGQRQYDELVGGTQFVPMVEITFEMVDSGTVGSVTVPQRAYSEDAVRAAIAPIAASMAAIHGMEG